MGKERVKNNRRKLIRYDLKKEKALQYFQGNLGDLNALSRAVLEFISFEEGVFYTLMPEGLTETQIYDFRGGCVKSYGIQEAVCKFVYDMQRTNSTYSCIFDDFTQDYYSGFYEEGDLFETFGVDYKNKEVYLIVDSPSINVDILQECFQISDCIWHSLMVMTSTSYEKNKDRSISKEQMDSMAKGAILVVLRAYDQEGYVFWERKR